MVTDKQRDLLEDAMQAVERIADWANAYPEDVFPEQNSGKADYILREHGISMSAMYGAWGRHITTGMRKLAESIRADLAEAMKE